MTDFEFYNTTYKDLMKSNKSFHFEVQQNYFNKSNVFKFISKIYDFSCNCDGYKEWVNLKLSLATTEILTLTKTCNSAQEPYFSHTDERLVEFLIDFNKLNCIKFPHYWWNVVYDIAEIKDGEFINMVVCG